MRRASLIIIIIFVSVFTVVQSLFSEISSRTLVHDENSDEKLQSFRVSVRYGSEYCMLDTPVECQDGVIMIFLWLQQVAAVSIPVFAFTYYAPHNAQVKCVSVMGVIDLLLQQNTRRRRRRMLKCIKLL